MRTLIIDLDNTLVECGKYYLQAIENGAQYIEQQTGISTQLASALINQLDAFSIKANGGFQRDRFPKSFTAALSAAALISGVLVTRAMGDRMYAIGEAVFDAEYALFEAAVETLELYGRAGWRIVIYTKGDQDVQWSKITRHELHRRAFVQIVPAKSVESLQQVLDLHGVDVPNSYAIGDSLRDDIAPANTLGLKTVYVLRPEQKGWTYEQGHQDTPFTGMINEIRELPQVIPLRGS